MAVACGGLLGSRSDWLVEKCAELGAHSLLPLLTERSPAFGAWLWLGLSFTGHAAPLRFCGTASCLHGLAQCSAQALPVHADVAGEALICTSGDNLP